jgi:sugar O-acyltransferase (sialic acid O-acetyltransferase NeuD family)
MTRPLILFGAGDIGELAHYYFENDSDYKVEAFTVDGAYLEESTFKCLPVVPFEEVASVYSPDGYDLFIALSYAKLNQARREKYLAAKALGYSLPSYVSSKATVLNDGRIGDNCFILEDNTIQPFVRIGNNVTLWSGNHIGHHSVIHDHCFVASQVVVSGGVEIGEACFLGVNATLRDHISVGENCVIGAGVLLLEDAQPDGVYRGPGTKRRDSPSSALKRI